jgi:hypothetical protein
VHKVVGVVDLRGFVDVVGDFEALKLPKTLKLELVVGSLEELVDIAVEAKLDLLIVKVDLVACAPETQRTWPINKSQFASRDGL